MEIWEGLLMASIIIGCYSVIFLERFSKQPSRHGVEQ